MRRQLHLPEALSSYPLTFYSNENKCLAKVWWVWYLSGPHRSLTATFLNTRDVFRCVQVLVRTHLSKPTMYWANHKWLGIPHPSAASIQGHVYLQLRGGKCLGCSWFTQYIENFLAGLEKNLNTPEHISIKYPHLPTIASQVSKKTLR